MNALKVLTSLLALGIAEIVPSMHARHAAALFLATIFMTILKWNLHVSIKNTRYEELYIRCSLKELFLLRFFLLYCQPFSCMQLTSVESIRPYTKNMWLEKWLNSTLQNCLH